MLRSRADSPQSSRSGAEPATLLRCQAPQEPELFVKERMLPKLTAAIQIKAIIRRAEVAGAHAFLVRRGSAEAGAIFLKLSRLDGTVTVLNQVRRGAGELVWMKPLGEAADEQTVARYLEKQARFDPDLWIIEIEDPEGRAFVDDPVV